MNKKQALEKLQIPDAFEGFVPDKNSKLWGWNGELPLFGELIEETRPKLIIEVGTWLGLSTATMARELKKQGLADASILAIDTFIGSRVHWEEMPETLELQHGFPTLYPRFLSNMMNAGCDDVVVPLPMTSSDAGAYLFSKGIRAELIYIDGSHEEHDVYDDAVAYWKLLAQGGVMFGDDWGYESVQKAVMRFSDEYKVPVTTKDGKWRVQKD